MTTGHADGSELPSGRARLLHAALDEFEANGYAGARIGRIADVAHANKQLVYRYFGNKRGLYEAVIMKLINDLREIDARSSGRGMRRVAPEAEQLQRDSAVRKSWTRILSWEGLQPVDRSDAAVDFITENYASYVAELEIDPDAAGALTRFPVRFVFALLLAADHLPYSTPRAFAAALGKTSVNDDDIVQWFEFVRELVGAIPAVENGESDETSLNEAT